MFKRILTVGAGVLLGIALSIGAARVSASWNLFPHRDLNRSSDYVKEVLQIVNENYYDATQVGYEALARNSIHGMVDSLDPHSQYLEAKDAEELDADLDGEFGGVGIEVEYDSGHFMVISPIAGGPCARAGVSRGDELVSIDGKALDKTSTMESVVDKLHGKPKTHVALGLLRSTTGKRFDVDITREMIKVESVRNAHVIDESVGYVQITEFSEHTGEQFVNAVNGLLGKGIDGLIIDLRDNPGGLLDAAVEVAEPFFKKGDLIVYTRGRKAEDREDFRAEADGDPLTIPVAILINAGTASAAEIVTGALKDTHKAVVVGERSFGKGSVQSIFKLKDGEELRLTTAHYFTPSGYLIHGHGISPEVEVVMTSDEDDKLRQQEDRADITDPKEFKAKYGWTPIEDRQLQTAVDILHADERLTPQETTGAKVSLVRRPARAAAARAK